MDYFPIFLNLKQQPCLVVGAGEVAARKISLLSKAGAAITVIATDISETVAAMENSHQLILIKKAFAETDVHNYRLVVYGTPQCQDQKVLKIREKN